MTSRRSRKSKFRTRPERFFAILTDRRAVGSILASVRRPNLRQAYVWAQEQLNHDILRAVVNHREVMICKTIDVVQPPNGRYRVRRIR